MQRFPNFVRVGAPAQVGAFQSSGGILVIVEADLGSLLDLGLGGFSPLGS